MTASSALLTDAERRTLSSVCDALFPPLEARDGDSPELFGLAAADVNLADAVEDAMQALSARQLRELRLFLRLLESRLFMLIAAGRLTPISRMTAMARESALTSLANSVLPPARSGYQALKRLAAFHFYSISTRERPNPTWRAIGYSLSEPAEGSSPLAIRRITQASTFDADVCIIGSGAAGGVVAQRLAAAGQSVIVLEAGPGDQASDFDQREIAGVHRLYLDRGTTSTRDLGVALLAGRCLGGGTSINWQTSLRLPDFIRDEWAERSGVRAFAEATFTSALDAVCERLHVGTSESTRNGNNTPLERACAALGYRWSEIPRNSQGCDLAQCGYCVFGCRVGGKQSTAVTYLRDAQEHGDTTIVASCRAERVRREAGRAAGVDAVAIDEHTGTRHDVSVNARYVVVAGGAVETAALLFRSGVEHKQLGRNLYLHPTSAVAGQYDAPVRGWIGAPQTVLCDEFARARGNYGYRFEAAPIHPGLLSFAQPWISARDHRTRMQHAADTSMFIVLTRDRHGGRVSIDRDGRAVIDYAVGRMERALLQQGIANAAKLHWVSGAREIHTFHSRDHTFRRYVTGRASDINAFCDEVARLPMEANRCGVFSAHQMGTARMGVDRKRDVCDETGHIYGMPGVYVADTSLFPASSGVNPMITVMALAHMVGDAIADRARR